VTIDFIVKLPSSSDQITEEVYDSILVIVDRLTKYTHFIPYKETYTAEQLARIVIDRLIRYHGIPSSFVTDRDKLFTSNYWKTLVASIGIRHKLSTSFHPQTDGQTERMNQTLEAYLRHYVNHTQNNWVSLLPMAQLALNNLKSESTQHTPFFANYGKHPNLFSEPRSHPNAQKALVASRDMRNVHDELRVQIQRSQQKMIKNDRSKAAPQLKKGDKVYLLTKNLRTTKSSKKLDHVKVGPFLIEEQKGPVNYRLRLPKDAKIHPVFHISLLEPADPETPCQETFYFEEEEEDEFEVEKILMNCQQLLRRFHQQHRGKNPKRNHLNHPTRSTY